MQRRVNIKPRFWTFLILLMLLCFTLSGLVSQLHYRRVQAQVQSLNAQKLDLMSRITQLSSTLDYMQTDAYIERVARDELEMLRPGEIRYVSN